MPPRNAASNFSFKPPIAVTSPRKVISSHVANIAAHRNTGKRRQTPCHCRASTRSILGCCAIWYVDVDVAFFERFILDAQYASGFAPPCAASTDSFITSPSEPGARDHALARHDGRFNGQQIAAHLGPRQADNLAPPDFAARRDHRCICAHPGTQANCLQ